jgi:hypothetical protein
MLFFFWKFWITLQQELCIPYQLADTTSQYWTRAWSYLCKFSDLRNFQKKSGNFKTTIFVRKIGKII